MKRTYTEMLPTLRIERDKRRRMLRIAKKHFRENESAMRRQWIDEGIAKHEEKEQG